MNKRNRTSFFVGLVLVLGVMSASVLFAAGSGNESSSNTTTILPVSGSDMKMSLMNPFEVGGNISMITLPSPSEEFFGSQLFPGQKIAEGMIRISNVSPDVDYGAHLRAEPQGVLSDNRPYFEVKVWVGDTLFYSPKDIPSGQTVELWIEVFIPYGAPASSFEGLDVIVSAVPSPTETIAKCPTSGCG